MTPAAQIAALINEHSSLTVTISPEQVSKHCYVTLPGVKACAKVQKLAWYLAEISHLVVHPDFRRRGHAGEIVWLACLQAKEMGARIAQCTVRHDNLASRSLFDGMGFVRGVSFIGPSGKEVSVWQKTL